MSDHIVNLNRPILDLADEHPAKRFLCAFVECRENCAQRELGSDGGPPVEQAWVSRVDGRNWTFSGFVYAFICFDIELDGFLENTPCLTESEAGAVDQLPLLRSMMNECVHAARHAGNCEILVLADQVLTMLSLWEQYLDYRRAMIASSQV